MGRLKLRNAPGVSSLQPTHDKPKQGGQSGNSLA
jgi:hypothetical protein